MNDFAECEHTGLMIRTCGHCQKTKEDPPVVFGNSDVKEFEIVGRIFEAQYRGHCTLDFDHPVKRGDKVAYVQRADNPMLPISGVACAKCVRVLPHA